MALGQVLGLASGATAHTGSAIQWGDVPTWTLAVIALAALIAAIAAYFKQADAAKKLGEQVAVQRDQLQDQQSANSKQAEALGVQLREIRQRTASVERQQADAIILTTSKWRGAVAGVPYPLAYASTVGGVHMALVENQSHRPIRNMVCRIQLTPGEVMHEACLVGSMVTVPPDLTAARGSPASRGWDELRDKAEDTKVPLVRAGTRAAFVFIYGIEEYRDARITLRLTDDAGLHWQVDHDLHLEQLGNRDDW